MQVVSPFIFLTSALYAARAFKISQRNIEENIAINRRNKRADAILHCNNRYDELQKLKISIDDLKEQAQQTAVKSYYARYWGLKSDEFDYWLAGLIDIETFCNWNALTLKALKSNSELINGQKNTEFKNGWQEIGAKDNAVPNPWFSELIEALVEISSGDGLTVAGYDELLEIIGIIESKSKIYRELLQRDMSLAEYIHTRKSLPKLGLSRGMRETSRAMVQAANRRPN